MSNFITITELKNSVLNSNLDDFYIQPAIDEAQNIYLREILGDSLYESVDDKIANNTLTGKYLTLLNNYIKPYLTYMTQSLIVVPLNFKIRNMGVINQYGTDTNTTDMKDTKYLADYYNQKAEFYANRLTTYLVKNADDITEYTVSEENITNPNVSQTGCNIYLGMPNNKRCTR